MLKSIAKSLILNAALAAAQIIVSDQIAVEPYNKIVQVPINEKFNFQDDRS